MKVLFVDDDPYQLDSLERMATLTGATVFTAANVEAAIDCIEQLDDLDLVVSDYDLRTVHTGADLARRSKQLRPDLRFILWSGIYREDQGDADMFLIKGSGVDRLVEELNRA